MAAAFLLLCLLHAGVCYGSPQSIYFIGNSFTWDAQPHNFATNTDFPNGFKPEIGWSIYSGKSLTYIVENPDKAVTEVGLVASDFYPDPTYTRTYELDLPNHKWQAISIQPSTFAGPLYLESEIDSANTIIAKLRENPDNHDTTVFIYESWAFQQGPDKFQGRTYSENWLSGYSQSQLESGALPNVRQALQGLYWHRIQEDNPGVTIKWIPTGEVLHRVDLELQKGVIPGVTGTWDLYDVHGVHLHDTNEDGIAGRYISHITTLCTIWGSEPSAFKTKYEDVIDEDFKALVDQVAWATILEMYPDIEACNLKPQTITFPNLPDISIQDASIQMFASTSSDLPVFYELISGPGSIYENTLQFLSPGTFTVQVSQPGNDEWSSAEPVTQTFDVYSIADSWRLEKFGSHKNEGDAANLADPDFDRIPNLFEYFLGTSPTSYDSGYHESIAQRVSQDTYVSFQNPSSTEGLEVWYEWSRNLEQWDAFPQEQVNVYENLVGDLVHEIDTSTIPKPHFIRLKLIPR